jgi:hypothetical protein
MADERDLSPDDRERDTPSIPMEAPARAAGTPGGRARKAWFEAEDDEEGAAGEHGDLGDGLEDLPDGEEGTTSPRGPGSETIGRRPGPRKPVPVDDVELLFKGGGGKAATPFKEEDDNKELRGCLMVVAVALVVGLAWFFLKDVIDFSGGPEETAPRKPPPITRVEAMKDKTVVDGGARATGAPLARKIVAPPEETEETLPPEAQANEHASGVAIEGMDDMDGLAPPASAPPDADTLKPSVMEALCLDGRPARRVPSLYGLRGGFAITFGEGPEDGPRLEFLPPINDRSGNVLFYAALGEPVVKGFEGREARTVANRPDAIQRVILAWSAGIVNGPCAP